MTRKYQPYPHCPICGEECEEVYLNKWLDIVGCEECISTRNAWGQAECFPQYEEDNRTEMEDY